MYCFIRNTPRVEAIGGSKYIQYVSIICSFEKTKYCGTASVQPLNIKANCTVQNRMFFPLNVAFASAYAAMAATIIYISEVTTLIATLLKIYLESGTLSAAIRSGKTR